MFKLSRRGFTLIELIVVLVILGILAALAIPTFQALKSGSAGKTALTSAQSIAREANALEALGSYAAHSDDAVEAAASDLPAGAAWTASSNTVAVAAGGSTGSASVTWDAGSSQWVGSGGTGAPSGSGGGSGVTPLSLSYASGMFTSGSVSQVLTPTVAGGSGTKSYAVTSGALPSGVVLDPVTGSLTGPASWAASIPVAGSVGSSDYPYGAAVLSDGTVLVIGEAGASPAMFGAINAGNTIIAKTSAAGGWDWASDISQTFPDTVHPTGVVATSDGGAVVSGWYYANPTFPGLPQLGGVYANAFVAKISASGAWQWVTTSSSALSEAYTNSVALAADGSIYVSGWYSYHAGETTDSMKFGGSVTLPGAVSNTGTPFLAKLTAAGSVQWVANAGVTYASMTAAKVVVLPSGDPVLVDPVFGGATGTPETISFAPAGSVVRANTNDHFVVLAKADKTTGAWQWVTRSGSSGAADNIYQLSAAADSSGNIYISAVYTGSGLTFGGAALPTPATTQLMVAKADSSGTWQWGSSASGTTGTLRPFGTTALADGNVVVAGEFDGTATFPGAPSTITETSSSQGAFVAKINSSGVWQWAASGGAATDNEAYATAQLPSGSLAVVGFVRGTAPAMFGSVGVTTGDPGSRDIFVGRISLAGAWEAPSLSIPSTLVTVTVTDTSGSAPAPVTITSS